MADNRFEIADEALESIVGGAYRFYPQEDGTTMLIIDNYGTYYGGEDLKYKFDKIRRENPTAKPAEIIDLCLEAEIMHA